MLWLSVPLQQHSQEGLRCVAEASVQFHGLMAAVSFVTAQVLEAMAEGLRPSAHPGRCIL